MVERNPYCVLSPEETKTLEFTQFGNEFKAFADTFFPYGIAEDAGLIEENESLLTPSEAQRRLDDKESPFADFVSSPEEAFPQADAFGGGVQSASVGLQVIGENWAAIAHIDAGWRREVGVRFKYLSEEDEYGKRHEAVQVLSMTVNSRTQDEPPKLRRTITRVHDGKIDQEERACVSEGKARYFLNLLRTMKSPNWEPIL